MLSTITSVLIIGGVIRKVHIRLILTSLTGTVIHLCRLFVIMIHFIIVCIEIEKVYVLKYERYH